MIVRRPRFISTCLLILVVLIAGLYSCQQQKEFPKAPTPHKQVILDQLAHPWSMAFINEEEALITELAGDILRVNLKTKSKTPISGFPKDLFTSFVLDISQYPQWTYPTSLDGQDIRGNAGILDIAIHPDYNTNHKVFISYVSEIGDTYALKVISAQLEGDSLTNIITILNPGPYVPGLWHFGGGICILDEYLYITVGERLFFEVLKEGLPIAQDVTDARGAIYRILLDGSIPEDNPDLGPEGVPGMYAFGIRAAQGITARPGTSEIWFSEHGTNQGDELNLLEAGANYGWPNITSGTWRTAYTPGSLGDPTYTSPKHFWLQTVAPTGLTFYTGSDFPTWHGNLIVPGLSRGSLWRFVLEGSMVVSAEELFINDHVRLRKAIQSPDGQLYVLTDEDDGKLVMIQDRN